MKLGLGEGAQVWGRKAGVMAHTELMARTWGEGRGHMSGGTMMGVWVTFGRWHEDGGRGGGTGLVDEAGGMGHTGLISV